MLTKPNFLTQLERLVSFKTLPGEVESNARALDYIQSLLSPKAKVKRLKNGQAEILLAGNTSSKTPQFGYLVHVDVVAGSPGMFKMKQENGQVFGRGVSDMKFSIPLGVALLNELIAAESQTSFSLAITTDEESGGFEGAKYLADDFGWQPAVLIVPDGGDNMNFVDRAKGVAQFEIISRGKSTHASRPWQGKNALPALSQLVVELEHRYGQNSLRENWDTTLNFGTLNGGISTNQVCDFASLKIDFRYPESTSFEEIETELQTLARKIDPKLEIKRLSYGLPTFTDVKHPEVRRFLQILGDKYGKKIKIKPTYGASDARHFAQFGMPVLMIKPLGGEIHSENEWLDLESTMVFYQGLREYLKT